MQQSRSETTIYKRFYGKFYLSMTQKVYEWIKDYMLINGYCPSVREICEGLGFKATSTAHRYLIKLEDQGLVLRKSEGSPVFTLTTLEYRELPLWEK